MPVVTISATQSQLEAGERIDLVIHGYGGKVIGRDFDLSSLVHSYTVDVPAVVYDSFTGAVRKAGYTVME